MRKCEICGAALPQGSRAWYCRTCGIKRRRERDRARHQRLLEASAPRERFCESCGAPLVPGSKARFCEACRDVRGREQAREQRERERAYLGEMGRRQENAREEAAQQRGLPHFRSGLGIEELTRLAREHRTSYGKLVAWMDLHRRRPGADEELA